MSIMHRAKSKKHLSLTDILIRLSVTVLMVYLVVSFIAGQVNIIRKKQELAEVNTKIEQQQAYNTELQRMLTTDAQGDYMESIARERLGYVYPDEEVYTDVSGK